MLTNNRYFINNSLSNYTHRDGVYFDVFTPIQINKNVITCTNSSTQNLANILSKMRRIVFKII